MAATSLPRWRRGLAWMRRHPFRTITLLLLLTFAALNFLAYQHARAMLVFRVGGERTLPPQSLSALQKLEVLVAGVSIPKPRNDQSPQDLGISFETRHIPSTDGAILEAWLLEPPEARGVVILFHGYAGAKSVLLREALEFRELGYAVVLVDFRGSGGSNGHTTSVGYYEADDVAATVRFVRSLGRPGPLILYGQSMGSAAVLRAVAVHELKPDGVILESAFDRMLTTVRNRFAIMGVPSFPAAELLVFWGGVQVGFSGFDHNPVEYASRCICPVLMLHGDADRHATSAEAQAVCENLAGPRRLVNFPGVEHTPPFRADPELWREVVRGFLKELEEKVRASER